MGNLYNVIQKLCDGAGIKPAKLCSDTGISKGLITDLKMGRRTGVSAITAQKIASYFGVSVGYLLGEEDAPDQPKPTGSLDLSNITEAQRMVIEAVLKMPEQKLEALALMLGL